MSRTRDLFSDQDPHMTIKPWPSAKLRESLPHGTFVDFVSFPADTTECKHGKGPCETCGTTNVRDRLHTVDARGRGAVEKIRSHGK